MGTVSVGLGALPILQQLLLAAPSARHALVVDHDLVTLLEHGDERAWERIEAHTSSLAAQARANVVVCCPELLGPRTDGLTQRVRSRQKREALELTRTGHIAVVGQSGRPGNAQALISDIAAAGGTGHLCLSSTLSAVASRGLDRDEITVSVVRDAAEQIRASGADTVVFLIPAAHLVEDLFQRSFGRGLAIVDSVLIWASEVAKLVPPHGEAARGPALDLIVAGGDGAQTAKAVTAFLQLPLQSVRTRPDLAAEAVISHRDEVLLAYDALSAGDRESTVAILRDYATVRERDRPHRSAIDVIDDSIRRRIQLKVDELVSTDDLVGVVGTATVPHRGNTGRYAFSHLLRFAAGQVAEIEIVECRRENAATRVDG